MDTKVVALQKVSVFTTNPPKLCLLIWIKRVDSFSHFFVLNTGSGCNPIVLHTVESEGRQIKQCWIKYFKNPKQIPLYCNSCGLIASLCLRRGRTGSAYQNLNSLWQLSGPFKVGRVGGGSTSMQEGQTRERAEGSKIASISCKLVPPIRETDSPLVEFAARFPLSDIYMYWQKVNWKPGDHVGLPLNGEERKSPLPPPL